MINLIRDGVRLIVMQFSFGNAKAVPERILHMPDETAMQSLGRTVRNMSGNGVLLQEPVMEVSLKNLVHDIEDAGFIFCALSHQTRQQMRRMPDGKETFHMVRGQFYLREHARKADPQIMKDLPGLRDALEHVCKDAFWRARVYRNPFFGEDGVPTEGAFALSVNMEVRTPLLQPDGSLVRVWQKDAEGNRIGTAPIPLSPRYHMTVEKGVLTVK